MTDDKVAGPARTESAMVAWLSQQVRRLGEQVAEGTPLAPEEQERVRRWLRATWGQRGDYPGLFPLVMGPLVGLYDEVAAEPLTAESYQDSWMQALVDAAVTVQTPGAEAWPLESQEVPAPSGPDGVESSGLVRRGEKAVELVKQVAAQPAPARVC